MRQGAVINPPGLIISDSCNSLKSGLRHGQAAFHFDVKHTYHLLAPASATPA
jgi:hypothetical protein